MHGFRTALAQLLRQAPFYTRADEDLASLRKSYERAELDETASSADPLTQFRLWLEQAIAAQLPEPNAMTLATVGADARPSTRIVLIKGLDERGIVWYSNYDSRKGRELAAHPAAALQFHWVELRARGPDRGPRREVFGRGVGRLLRDASARFAHRRLGLAAERGDRVACGARGHAARYGAPICARPPRAALGRVPPA
jgi:pyridoxamine 5'-phosphate oxidase